MHYDGQNTIRAVSSHRSANMLSMLYLVVALVMLVHCLSTNAGAAAAGAMSTANISTSGRCVSSNNCNHVFFWFF